MATLSLWDSKSTTCLCTVYRSAACRREVVQFCFCLRTVSQQITSWALLVNRPCMFRHEENLCLFVIHFCYVSTQCFHACWHVSHDHIIHIFHAHSAWLKTSSKPRIKRVQQPLLVRRCSLSFPGLPQRGKLPHPTPPPPHPPHPPHPTPVEHERERFILLEIAGSQKQCARMNALCARMSGFAVRRWVVCNVRRWIAFNVRRWVVDPLTQHWFQFRFTRCFSMP